MGGDHKQGPDDPLPQLHVHTLLTESHTIDAHNTALLCAVTSQKDPLCLLRTQIYTCSSAAHESLQAALWRWLEQRLLELHNDGRHVVAADALAFPGVGRQAGVQQL